MKAIVLSVLMLGAVATVKAQSADGMMLVPWTNSAKGWIIASNTFVRGTLTLTNEIIPRKFHTAEFTNAALLFVNGGSYCELRGHRWKDDFSSAVFAVDGGGETPSQSRRCVICRQTQTRLRMWTDWR